MRLIGLLGLFLAINLNAQVCCSPVGNGQAGGGAILNNWNAHWPNTLLSDQNWHWMSDLQLTSRGPAGNIYYGPQINALIEISHSFSLRNVLFITGASGLGTLEERVTYQNYETVSYSGRLSAGLRRAMGNRGRSYAQVMVTAPSPVQYVDSSFPFDSEEAVTMGILVLHNQPMPWSEFHPEFLSVLSMSIFYQKNMHERDNILSDNRSLIHLSSSIHSWYPAFIAPFIQLRSEQLLAPPSIWTAERDTRMLANVSVGLDLALSKPGWDSFKLRLGLPIASWSSSNGFPDGTQPAAYLMLAVNYGGLFGTDG